MDSPDELEERFHHGFYTSGITLGNCFSWFCSGIMMVGGVFPYIPQYLDIKRTESTDGFSMYVCLALLLANTLRILFWFGHAFELPLLLQSIIMIVAMLSMVRLCVLVRQRTQIVPTSPRAFIENQTEKDSDENSSLDGPATPRVFMDFDQKYFWEWTDFLSYIEFLATFMCMVGALVYLFLAVPVVIETIGFLAVLIEAMLGIPQFYRNFQNKSTAGMSIKMVALWAVGDIYKTVYFIIKDSPLQFLVCGALQIIVDIAILTQVAFYGSSQSVLVARITKPYTHSS